MAAAGTSPFFASCWDGLFHTEDLGGGGQCTVEKGEIKQETASTRPLL